MALRERIRGLRQDGGQAVTEYALIAFWAVIIVFGALKALEVGLLNYFQDIACLICLPIP